MYLFDKLITVSVMEIIFNVEEKTERFYFEKNVIFFGKNTNFKNKFISTLIRSLQGKDKNILIDGKKHDLNDYNIITINEESDLSSEFKFSKNNSFRDLIYHDIMSKINEEKLISCTNEIFDVIDTKVNKLLDRKINKSCENNVSFQIEIPSVTSIIDKFTNIYIDNLLLNDSEISKSMKRKLLYELYFLNLKNDTDNKNIVIIENFDVYLNQDETIHILNEIEKLSSSNCYFIISTCNNIFEYLNIDDFNVYKVSDKLINLDLINEAIKCYLLKKECNCSEDFEKFYLDNEHLISDDEIFKIKNNLINNFPHKISKVLNSTNVNLLRKKPNKITTEYILCDNDDSYLLFSEICKKFVD